MKNHIEFVVKDEHLINADKNHVKSKKLKSKVKEQIKRWQKKCLLVSEIMSQNASSVMLYSVSSKKAVESSIFLKNVKR